MSLTIPTIKITVNEVEVEPREIIDLGLHIGCTKEVSSFELVVDNGNLDLNAGDYYVGGDKEFLNGKAVAIYLKRGSITGSTKPLFQGKVENIDIIDEAEEYNYRNVVIISGRCKASKLFDRKFNGDLIDVVGVGYKNYTRTSGDASSLVAYLIDNYTTFSHSRVNSNITSQAASAQKVVNVADGSKFTSGDLVKIEDGATWEYNKVQSVSVNAVTMVSNLINTYENTGYLDLDLIRTSNTSFTKMLFEHESIFDIMKYIADVTSSTGGIIGYDWRVEYDSCFAFLPRGSLTESYSPLTGECQLERYGRTIAQVKNKIWVYGKDDKPYPLENDGQAYSDTWTETLTCQFAYPTGPDQIAISSTVAYFTDCDFLDTGDYFFVIDLNSPGEFKIVSSFKAAHQESLTLQANSGQKDVQIGDTSNYDVGEIVMVQDSTPQSEWCTIASKTSTVLTMVNNLTNTYTLAQSPFVYRYDKVIVTEPFGNAYTNAQNAVAFKCSGDGGWGFIPYVTENQYAITQETVSPIDTGSKSIEVAFAAALGYCQVLLLLNTPVNFDLYPKILLKLYFETTAPTMGAIKLYSGTLGVNEIATLNAFRGLNADEWTATEVEAGSKFEDAWVRGANFDWTDVKVIAIYLEWPSSDTWTFWIDRMYIGARRWGGGSDNEEIDGFASDGDSQDDYGIKEYVLINDMLLSDKECEAKAQSLLKFYKDERKVIEVSTETLDWGDGCFTPGNLAAITFGKLGVDDSFRVDAVDITLSGKENRPFIIFSIDNAPPRVADYLYRLSKRVRQLERYYRGIR